MRAVLVIICLIRAVNGRGNSSIIQFIGLIGGVIEKRDYLQSERRARLSDCALNIE